MTSQASGRFLCFFGGSWTVAVAIAAGCGGGTQASIGGPTSDPVAQRDWAAALVEGPTPSSPSEVDGEPIQVSAGLVHTCSLRRGEVWCWGDNREGELGDGTLVPRHVPRKVPGISDAVSVAAGQSFSCAVRATGDVLCWGDNRLGQLGDGTTRSRGTPAPVRGTAQATRVAAGAWHACAIHDAGAVACWGREGTLSEPPHALHPEPFAVPGLEDAVHLSVGGNHTCAVRRSGQVVCWGDNTAFQLGDGTREFRAAPHTVPGIDDAVEVLAGSLQSCALRRSGVVECWGNVALNTDAQAPEEVPGLADAIHLSGMYDPCAIRRSGEVVCWGHDENGQSVETRRGPPPPVPVVGVRDAVQISATNHVCAVLRSGELSCWGANEYGEVGVDPRLVFLEPAPISGGLHAAIDLYAGDAQTCALVRGGEVLCATGDPEGARPILGLARVRELTAGPSQPCAILEDGTASCWARWASPFGGCSGATSAQTPGRLSGLSNVVDVAGNCAVLRGGRVVCWVSGDRMHPPPDACMPRDTGIADARAIVAGVGGHCALHRDGHVSCWGADLHGERGTAGSGESAGPVRMGGLSDAVGLSAGAEHACAVHRDGRVLCWGENLFGQLGDGTLESRATPVPVIGVNDAVEVAAGNRMFTCARRRIGSVVCWGLTERIPRTPPPRMVTLAVDDAAQVVAGPDHACVRRVGGDVLCWGINRNGQFGVLPRAHVNSPVVVSP